MSDVSKMKLSDVRDTAIRLQKENELLVSGLSEDDPRVKLITTMAEFRRLEVEFAVLEAKFKSSQRNLQICNESNAELRRFKMHIINEALNFDKKLLDGGEA